MAVRSRFLFALRLSVEVGPLRLRLLLRFLFLDQCKSALSSTGTTRWFDVLGPPRTMASLVETGGARPVHDTTGTTSFVPGIVPLKVECALGQSSLNGPRGCRQGINRSACDVNKASLDGHFGDVW